MHRAYRWPARLVLHDACGDERWQLGEPLRDLALLPRAQLVGSWRRKVTSEIEG